MRSMRSRRRSRERRQGGRRPLCGAPTALDARAAGAATRRCGALRTRTRRTHRRLPPTEPARATPMHARIACARADRVECPCLQASTCTVWIFPPRPRDVSDYSETIYHHDRVRRHPRASPRFIYSVRALLPHAPMQRRRGSCLPARPGMCRVGRRACAAGGPAPRARPASGCSPAPPTGSIWRSARVAWVSLG